MGRARREHGVRIGYIFDIAGELGATAAYATLEHALSRPPEALTGFGLAGIEQARPANADVFRSVFDTAITAGLHSVPHAGEMSGPATIWEAVDGLRAERIGHGISCLADPAWWRGCGRARFRSRCARRPTSAPGRSPTWPRTRCRGCSNRACS